MNFSPSVLWTRLPSQSILTEEIRFSRRGIVMRYLNRLALLAVVLGLSASSAFAHQGSSISGLGGTSLGSLSGTGGLAGGTGGGGGQGGGGSLGGSQLGGS